MNTIVSIGISLAILNATLAIILELARIVFSAARDRAFPGPLNTALAHVDPRLRTPWIATLVVGAAGAVLMALSSVAALVELHRCGVDDQLRRDCAVGDRRSDP